MKIPHPNNQSFQDIWGDLSNHYNSVSKFKLIDLFKNEDRHEKFSVNFENIHFDFSRNLVTNETLDLLISLAKSIDLQSGIDSLFKENKLNISEIRPVLHTALRADPDSRLDINGNNVISMVQNEMSKIESFVEGLHSGNIKGSGGKSIATFINIGIGGSDLGPRLVVSALENYSDNLIDIYFVSNVDPADLGSILKYRDPETTLFCISSKSFTTKETLHNASSAKKWLIDNGCEDTGKHFVAVSGNEEAVKQFGINSENFFHIREWVGGRYSLWSPTGLPIAVSIGMENFKKLLTGARRMDQHFHESPLEKNIPVMLGMLDIWHNNFLKSGNLAIIPYSEQLKLLPDYLGQLIMESNGKSVSIDNEKIDYPTCPIIWGGVGTNSQHAFFQMLHQGTNYIPVDFLIGITSQFEPQEQQDYLAASCLAQAQALMLGQSSVEDEIFKQTRGNNPSTVIIYEKLDPETLGALLAMYEHRTFVQGQIWNINSFDQWGVELGKKIADNIYQDIKNKNVSNEYDDSTKALINKIICKKIT